MKTSSALALCVVVLSAGGCIGPAPEGEEIAGDVEAARAAVTYDSTMVKPVPTAYLFKKMDGNVCCSGLNQSGGSCTNACATKQGLITQAGYDEAFSYYRATGQDALDTLDKWKSYFKFPKRLPGEAIDTFRKRTNTVIYYNRTELALGRELACAQDGGTSIACYVTNYGDSFGSVHDLTQPDNESNSGLAYARYGDAQPKNTVVISYDVRRESKPGDGKAVQFAAFGPDGKRLQKAQLDNQGARPIPQICMTCHGGVWDPDSRAASGTSTPVGAYYGISSFARFLPLITSTVTWSGTAPYRLADQESAILAVNQAAWNARGTGLTARQRSLMTWLYQVSSYNYSLITDLTQKRAAMMQNDVLAFSPSTPGRQYAENAWPGGWSTKTSVYNGVVLPYCDTCHLALDPSGAWTDLSGAAIVASAHRAGQGGTTYTALQSLSGSTSAATLNLFKSLMGVSTNASGLGVFGDRGALMMPHAEQTFERFWADTTGVGGYSCTYGPMGDCFMRELGIWPNGRAQPKTAQNPTGIDWAALSPTVDAECGQSVYPAATTSGVNGGRRLASVALPAPLQSTYINQCADGCRVGALCPGSETAGASPPFPGARQECQPTSPGAGVGSCVSCGRIGEHQCLQVGATCDTTLNPNCKNLPACHEGVNNYGMCLTIDLVHNGGVTASQSSTDIYGANLAIDNNYGGTYSRTNAATDPTPWWKVDLGKVRKVKQVNIDNITICCQGQLGNFVVESSTDNSTFTTVANGDYTGVFAANGNTVQIVIPKAVDARYVRIRHLLGGPPNDSYTALMLGEVTVLGW